MIIRNTGPNCKQNTADVIDIAILLDDKTKNKLIDKILFGTINARYLKYQFWGINFFFLYILDNTYQSKFKKSMKLSQEKTESIWVKAA